ncbi:hypothetical protein C5615_10800 [Burkholderia cepacia]|uniref:Uncharacterized protein n=2 Tax=Burkholderia cepacia TaxID=292 RepID=A0A2S8IWH4_BURCE|nr:hypothetical protein C5615_10800 [Burkholderia cepacia]HDR9507186.1 hypothetical protein [Burkholderia cepacia]
MKNEIVTPAGANGEAGRRRRLAAVAVRAALACVGVTGSDAGRVATGKGRLPFFSAPDDACRIDGLFIVEHDHVDARIDYGRFTSVVYLNPRTNGIAEGWVQTARLKPDGNGSAPRRP